MEEDLKEIEDKLLQFCRNYNCTIEADTITEGRDTNGKIQVLKVCTKIQR